MLDIENYQKILDTVPEKFRDALSANAALDYALSLLLDPLVYRAIQTNSLALSLIYKNIVVAFEEGNQKDFDKHEKTLMETIEGINESVSGFKKNLSKKLQENNKSMN